MNEVNLQNSGLSQIRSVAPKHMEAIEDKLDAGIAEMNLSDSVKINTSSDSNFPSKYERAHNVDRRLVEARAQGNLMASNIYDAKSLKLEITPYSLDPKYDDLPIGIEVSLDEPKISQDLVKALKSENKDVREAALQQMARDIKGSVNKGISKDEHQYEMTYTLFPENIVWGKDQQGNDFVKALNFKMLDKTDENIVLKMREKDRQQVDEIVLENPLQSSHLFRLKVATCSDSK